MARRRDRSEPISEFEIEVRVRYAETDAMGVLHHATYPIYFEMARTEALRACGGSYRDMEESGFFLVIAEMSLKYRKPARFDDVLRVIVRTMTVSAVKLIHEYEVRRGDDLLTEGRTVLACVDREGQIQRMPQSLVATLGGED